MNLLVVLKADALNHFVVTFIETKAESVSLDASSFKEALTLVDKNQKIDAVVLDYGLDDGSGAQLLKKISSLNPKAAVLAIGPSYPPQEVANSYPNIECLDRAESLERFPKLLASLDKKQKSFEDDYIAVRIDVLRSLEKLPCDVFVRLSKEKHVKVMNKGDVPDTVALEN